MAFMMLRNIENELVNEAHTAYFPPILDDDPERASESLTINDSVIALNALKDVYNSLTNDTSTPYAYLKEAILHSYSNFIWFASFFKKLQELYSTENNVIPYQFAPEPASRDIVYIFPPSYLVCIKDKFKISYEDINIPVPSLLNKHRASYIFKGHELSDFRCGFPNWYMLKSTTVFEKYSEKINKRVKISFRDGEFRYFISGASDNWQEILDVPLEIDDVVAALLFKN